MHHNVSSIFKFAENDVDGPQVHLERDGMFKIQAQEPGKVADTFEVEFVAYHFCHHLLRYNLSSRFDEVDAWLRGKKAGDSKPDGATLGILDKVYEETLAFVEFILNRLTTYSDECMEQFMIGVRFSLCYYLRMDRSHVAAHSRRHAGNTILFRHKELSSIVSLDHVELKKGITSKPDYSYDDILDALKKRNAARYREVIAFYDIIRNTVLCDCRGKPSVYVEVESGRSFTDSLVSDCWQNVRPGTVSTSRGSYVPLMEVVRKMEDLCRREPVFGFQAEADYSDMCSDIIVANSALLGFVGNRDTQLNYGSLAVSELPRRYNGTVGMDMLKHCLLVARVIDCIIFGSRIEKQGTNGVFNLRFKARSMVRMMDSEVFGRQVYIPNLIFVNRSQAPMESYEQYLQSLGFNEDKASHGHSFVKIVDDLQSLEVEWDSSDRVKAKPKGCFSHIRSVSHLPLGDFAKKDMRKFRNGTIIVCDIDQKSDVIRAVRNAIHSDRAFKDSIWRIVVLLNGAVAGREYTMVDARDGNFVEVGLAGNSRLFDTHTNGIVVRTLVALNTALSSICDEYDVADGDALDAVLTAEDVDTVVKKEFLGFYKGMSSEIEMMNNGSVWYTS